MGQWLKNKCINDGRNMSGAKISELKKTQHILGRVVWEFYMFTPLWTSRTTSELWTGIKEHSMCPNLNHLPQYTQPVWCVLSKTIPKEYRTQTNLHWHLIIVTRWVGIVLFWQPLHNKTSLCLFAKHAFYSGTTLKIWKISNKNWKEKCKRNFFDDIKNKLSTGRT